MGRFIDLIGQQFERLIVNKYIGKNKWGQSLWLCKCNCGKEKEIVGNNLLKGRTKSCGCLVLKHGQTKYKKKTRTYTAWTSMKNRCNNPNNQDYKDYGGRGIIVCNRWLNKENGFKNFLEDMGEVPKRKSLDRIDNNLGYYKKNCCWSTQKEQGRNKRNNHLISFNDRKLCPAEWEEVTGIKNRIISRRIKRGWSIEKALTYPVGKYRNDE